MLTEHVWPELCAQPLHAANVDVPTVAGACSVTAVPDV
jgi:hypothetical protein